MARFGTARPGPAGFGSAGRGRRGTAGHGVAWLGAVWQGRRGEARFVMVGRGKAGIAGLGPVSRVDAGRGVAGGEGQGWARSGLARHGIQHTLHTGCYLRIARMWYKYPVLLEAVSQREGLMHQLIEPSEACRRLKHRIDTRMKLVGSGKYEICVVCSLGYEMAMTQFYGDEAMADEFVKDLRRHA